MRVALYKGTRPGAQGLFNRLIRWWSMGPYSHCELVFSDGMSASSSFIDGGVRFKAIDYSAENWDFIDLSSDFDETKSREWFNTNIDSKYDLIGVLRFGFSPIKENRHKYFCSEAVMAALGYKEAWRFDACVVKSILEK